MSTFLQIYHFCQKKKRKTKIQFSYNKFIYIKRQKVIKSQETLLKLSPTKHSFSYLFSWKSFTREKRECLGKELIGRICLHLLHNLTQETLKEDLLLVIKSFFHLYQFLFMYFVSFDKKKKSTFGLTCTIKSETNISVEVLTPKKKIYLWKQEDNLLLPHILIMLILLYFQGKKCVCNYCK